MAGYRTVWTLRFLYLSPQEGRFWQWLHGHEVHDNTLNWLETTACHTLLHSQNEMNWFTLFENKGKEKVKERIVLSEIHLRTMGRHLSMVLSATRQRWPPRLYSNRASWYSIYQPQRLSWPSWLVSNRDSLPARRRSPIPVLTGSDVAQLRWWRPTRYH